MRWIAGGKNAEVHDGVAQHLGAYQRRRLSDKLAVLIAANAINGDAALR